VRVPRFPLVVVAAALPVFMATLDNLVVTTALPTLQRALGASLVELEWVTNAFTLTLGALILLAVALGDRFGRRRLFAVGITVFAAGSALCALSTTATGLIAARAVTGAGAAAVVPLSLALLSSAVPPARRSFAIGLWSAVSGLGVALGPLVGGAVLTGWSWQTIFWVNVPVAAVALPLALIALPESFGHRARIDVAGVGLAGGGVLGVLNAVVQGNSSGWTSAVVLVCAGAGAALLVAFVLWQRRASAPLLPLRLFRSRTFTITNLVVATFSFGVFGAVFLLTQFLQVVQHRSALDAGLMTTPWTLAPMLIAPLAGAMVPRLGGRTVIVAGLATVSAGVAWLALVLSETVAYPLLLPGFLAAGVGMGLVLAPISTLALAGIAPEDRAKASGTNASFRQVGVALGIATLSAVFASAGGTFTATGYLAGARPAVLLGALVLLATTVLAAALPRRNTPAVEVVSVRLRPSTTDPAVPAPAA